MTPSAKWVSLGWANSGPVECSGGMRVRDRVVVVTGATSGIGAATALRLAAHGARVWAVGRNEARLARMAARHPLIVPFRADVTVDADRAALVDAVGPVDVLVNNAGIGWFASVADTPPEKVRALFETNVLALIDLTQRILPGMLERRRGHVVNMSSVAAWSAVPPLTVYSATKFAVQGFTEGVRRENLFTGVTVGSVNPGPIATEFFTRSAGDEPGDGEATVGPGTGLVARAVVRSIRLRHVPGYQTIAVPRVLGLGRLLTLSGANRLADVAGALYRVSPSGARPWVKTR